MCSDSSWGNPMADSSSNLERPLSKPLEGLAVDAMAHTSSKPSLCALAKRMGRCCNSLDICKASGSVDRAE